MQGLGRGWGLLVFFGVLLVHVRFFIGTLRSSLPVTAEFIFDEVESGEIGPLGAGEFFYHQLHPLLVDLAAHVGFALAGGGAGHDVGAFDLPADIGSAVEAFASQRGSGEEVVDAVVEAHGVLSSVFAAAAAAGLIFGIGGFAEDDLVAIGRGHADQSLGGKPAGDGFALGFFVVFVVGILAGIAEDGLDVSPIAAAVDDDEFVAALDGAEFGGVAAGGDADAFFVNERAALGLAEAQAGESQQRGEEKRKEVCALEACENAGSSRQDISHRNVFKTLRVSY